MTRANVMHVLLVMLVIAYILDLVMYQGGIDKRLLIEEEISCMIANLKRKMCDMFNREYFCRNL